MSDSEEDFQSADEGEQESLKNEPPKKNEGLEVSKSCR